MNPGALIYLACPYSKPWRDSTPGQAEDRSYLATRAEDASLAAALLMQDGHSVFSPISHGHAIGQEARANKIGLGITLDTWRAVDQAMIRACDAVYVLTLPGWEMSEGIREEILFARTLGKPIFLVRLVPGQKLYVSEYREVG